LPEFDIKNEALIPLLKREIKAHFHCHRADDIMTAVRIAKEFNLDYVLIHCTEGHIMLTCLERPTQQLLSALL
jgi:imidazolonepropionase-like amidohydrolase